MSIRKKKTVVILSKRVEKDLLSLPMTIKEAFKRWFEIVEEEGIEVMRGIRGFRDEKLKGSDLWSCRLSKAYRLYYKFGDNKELIVEIVVIGIDKHLYGKGRGK